MAEGPSRAECLERAEFEGFAQRLEEERWAYQKRHGVFPSADWEAKHKRAFGRWFAAKRSAEKHGQFLTFREWLAQDEEARAARDRSAAIHDDFGPLDYDEVGT